MTLVELLVVIAIIGLLLAVSVPIIKPMLETRRTSNAAQVLAGAFQQARLKSIQEQRSYGVRLVPFGTAPTVSVQLQMEAAATPIVTLNPPDIRVRVEEGFIVPYRFDIDDGWQKIPQTEQEYTEILALFQEGYEVQFNRLGRSFLIGKNHQLVAPYQDMWLPERELGSNEVPNDALEYRIMSTWEPLTTWQTMMPHGTVVDLAFSGGETLNFDSVDKKPGDLPAAFLPLLPGEMLTAVTVMFSPAGHVDTVRIDTIDADGNDGFRIFKVNEMLYFCVGEWDRQVDATGNPLAEDKKTNLAASATYWVSLHPKTGGTRITENAPIQPGSTTMIDWLHDARKFAREHFYNVGGR